MFILGTSTYVTSPMATILFYSPFNQRSRDTESLMIAFRKQGHRVISLSQSEGLQIHDFLRIHGIETHSFIVKNTNGWVRHLRHLFFLIRFCRSNKIQVVYSHLEAANFIASVAQFFIPATIYLCRHHSDQYNLLKLDGDLSYKITYRLARHIIAFSEASKNYMINKEGVEEKRILKINLAYDFSLYQKLSLANVAKIKEGISADIVLISIGSLAPLKRPETSVLLLKTLIDDGYDAKLILLGKGDLDKSLRSMIEKLNLSGNVLLPGYVDNVLEYIGASSFLVHPSVSESSCVVVKEAGLVKLPVIVCKGVGDFDDYIVHGENGFSVDRNKFVVESTEIIKQNFRNKNLLEGIGENLRKSVLGLFSVEKVIREYDTLNNAKL